MLWFLVALLLVLLLVLLHGCGITAGGAYITLHQGGGCDLGGRIPCSLRANSA